MTKSALTVFLFWGSTVFACPNLSGVFTCTTNLGSSDSETAQSVDSNGVTTYTEINPKNGKVRAVWIADGLARETSGCSSTLGPGCFMRYEKASFTCVDNKLVRRHSTTVYRPEGELMYNLETINKFSINSDGNWQTEFIEINQDGTLTQPQIQTCVRK